VSVAGVVIIGGIGAVIGAVVGGLGRALLRKLKRGTVLPLGPLEISGAIVTAVGAVVAWGDPVLFLVVPTGWFALLTSAVDARHHRLPDALTLPAIPLAAVLVALTWWRYPSSGSLLIAAVVAVVVWAVFALVATVSPNAMGRGDVKLVPSLALATGYLSVTTAVLWLALGFVLGALFAVGGMLARRLTRRSAIPLGPFLSAGAWLALLAPNVAPLLV
jgi:leader peptidase (prepilin peptidase) / N-methyltransferase